MLTCKGALLPRPTIQLQDTDTGYSDGSTPKMKAEQILSIAPILKGQPPMPALNPNGQPAPPPPTAAQGNLIDFDQPATSSVPQAPTQSHSSMMSQPADAPAGLQEPLQPGQPLKRVDTLTSDVDEFVDAKPL